MPHRLEHTPAHVISVPDLFVDLDTGIGYSVVQDTSPEDPRSWTEDEQVALFVYYGPGGRNEEDPKNLAAQAFWRFHDYGTAEQAIALTRRYLNAFHPDPAHQYNVEIQTVRGYSQGDWRDVFVAVAPGFGTPQQHIDEYRMWCFGDVWVVSPDNAYDPNGALAGIYAETPEGALAQYLEQHESVPPPTPDISPDPDAESEGE